MELDPQHVGINSITIVKLLQNAYRTQHSDPNYTLVMLVPFPSGGFQMPQESHIQIFLNNYDAAYFFVKMFYYEPKNMIPQPQDLDMIYDVIGNHQRVQYNYPEGMPAFVFGTDNDGKNFTTNVANLLNKIRSGVNYGQRL